jgi:RNA ligase (TIGR02306 family)
MSNLDVKVRKVNSIETHPNADALDLAVIGGYRAVVKRDEFNAGDLVLYVPDDTLFNDLSVAEDLGIAPYLTGKGKNRVKPIRLRGELSQGIVVPLEKLNKWLNANIGWTGTWEENADVANLLNVEKYEEPISIQMAGKMRPWPSFIPKYDVENIKRPESMAAVIDGEEVVVTEKLHGTNVTIGVDEDGKTWVCSRNTALQFDLENVYWKVSRKYGLGHKVRSYQRATSTTALGWRSDNAGVAVIMDIVPPISLHGEIVGVQDLKYGHNGGDCGFYAFDIRVNGLFAPYDDFVKICTYYSIPMVPELYRGPYEYKTIAELAKGKTCLADGCHIREGVVAKPLFDRYDHDAGRVQFKFLNEDYLLRKGGTEMH